MMAGKWKLLRDELPELDTRVLLFFGNQTSKHVEAGYVGDDGDGIYHYFYDGNSLCVEPTHWMEIPELPAHP
jgi:hypothetical protein